MKLVIATRNAHKLEEICQILDLSGLDICSSLDFPEIPDVEEDGETFEANALKKARTLAEATGCWALADDSGLEVDALDGQPGVYSARFAGEPVDYDANNRLLLQKMEGREDRAARFRCVMALVDPAGRSATLEGRCEGMITEAARGHEGFGYDPVFVPEGFEQTFAEMSGEQKNRLSHRGRALEQVEKQWGKILASGQWQKEGGGMKPET
jgi:XTP/dITP diphosphohydrolase